MARVISRIAMSAIFVLGGVGKIASFEEVGAQEEGHMRRSTTGARSDLCDPSQEQEAKAMHSYSLFAILTS